MEHNVSRVTYNQVSLGLSMKEQFLSNDKKIGVRFEEAVFYALC